MIFFNKDNLIWTQHSLQKLKQYRLSASRVLRVLRHPKRREVGVAENTVACMQSAGTGKHPYEIWVMYQTKSLRKTSRLVSANARSKNIDLFPEPFDYTQGKLRQRVTIISTWRYPGVSPIGEPPPIPEEVWEELNKSG